MDIVAVVTLERVERAVNRRFGSGGGRRCRRCRRLGGLFLRRRTVALVELPTRVVRLFVRRAVGLGAQRVADEELGGVDGGGGSTLTFKDILLKSKNIILNNNYETIYPRCYFIKISNVNLTSNKCL